MIEQPKILDHLEAFELGDRAFHRGESINDNPHHFGSDNWDAWRTGFVEGHRFFKQLESKDEI